MTVPAGCTSLFLQIVQNSPAGTATLYVDDAYLVK